MKRLIFLCLSAFLLCTGCNEPEPLAPLQITGFHLSSTSPTDLARWYVKNLDFEFKQGDDFDVLEKNGTSIQIDRKELSTVPATAGQRQPGFFKFGFKTPDLDTLHARLIANGSNFRGDIFYDENLKMRSLVALDSDGNRVQFFEDKAMTDLQPYFFSVMALDFEQTKDWVESELGFEETHRLDLPERGFLIRLMEKDGVLLELISDERISENSQSLPGINGIGFNRSGKRNGAGVLRYHNL